LETVLVKPKHSLIDQSLHSRLGFETTNGDGFGVGWYGNGDGPGLYRSIQPAWGDQNLRELAGHVSSPLFLAHIRATTGTAIQETNCHPHRHGNWLFVHNGLINDFHLLRREMMLELRPDLFASIQGSTDSEVLFDLALTYGLEEEPIAALERAIGFVEAAAAAAGIEEAIQASIGVSDGTQLWAVRYSTVGKSRTLFASADADSVKRLYPGNAVLQELHERDRIIVSEPLADLPGAWIEIPEAAAIVVHADGSHDERTFTPAVPSAAG
jgi:glutamine amidotransferase